VALAERLGKPLDQLSLAELQSVEKRFAPDALETFNLDRAMARRNLTGAPGTKEVRKQLQRWRARLGEGVVQKQIPRSLGWSVRASEREA
jgi:argininosuccinate lyase